jgi:hypothetical protein
MNCLFEVNKIYWEKIRPPLERFKEYLFSFSFTNRLGNLIKGFKEQMRV